MYLMPAEDFLEHHGIKGMKWGKRNGPPYPLSSDISTGHRLKTDASKESSTNKERFHLSDRQKAIARNAAIIGVAAVGTYALYKSGAIDTLAKNAGKARIERAIKEQQLRNMRVNGLDQKRFDAAHKMPLNGASGLDIGSVSYTDVNPSGSKRNCVGCSWDVILRMMGIETKGAKPIAARDAGLLMSDPDIVRKAFKGSVVKTLGNSAKASPDGCRQFLRNKFGDNAFGQIVVCFDMKRFPIGPTAHSFNFQIVDGTVSFIDKQQAGLTDSRLSNLIWPRLAPHLDAWAADMSGSTPNWDEIGKLVNR